MSRTIQGVVTSDKGHKTVVITVSARKTHPLYRKQYTVTTKFMAHDEKNEARLGDLVSIVETRPLSARKRFKIAKILQRGGARFEETDAIADIPQEEEVTPEQGTVAKKKEAAK